MQQNKPNTVSIRAPEQLHPSQKIRPLQLTGVGILEPDRETDKPILALESFAFVRSGDMLAQKTQVVYLQASPHDFLALLLPKIAKYLIRELDPTSEEKIFDALEQIEDLLLKQLNPSCD